MPGGPPTRTTRDDSTGDLAALANAAPADDAPRQASTDTLYVTASGKAMDLSVGAVPTARKRRKVIRATVIGGFILCVLVLIGLIIFTANMLFSDKTPKIGPDPEYVGIDPSVNPITQPQVNVLGIPVGRETAIVLDATSSSRVWYTQVAQIVAHTVAQSDTIDFMIIPWTDLTPKPFPGATPAKITRDKLGALDNALAQSPVGLTSPLEFVQLALTGKADQIILVTGRPLDADEFTALSEAIGKHVNTRFDAVVIDQHDPALQKLANDNLGTYVSVKADQVRLWYEQWKKN